MSYGRLHLKSSLKSPLRFLYFAVSILCTTLAGIVLFLALYLLAPINIPANSSYLLEIKRGESLYVTTNTLAEKNILRFPRLFRVIVYLLGQDSNIRTGEYELKNSTRVHELIKKITSGDVKQYNITIIEGSNLNELLTKIINTSSVNSILDIKILNEINAEQNILNNLKLLNQQLVNNETIINLNEVFTLEGLFYPDTYFYTKGASIQELFNRSFIKLNMKLKQEWDNRADKTDQIVKTPYQALILASILEKEAADSNERKLVAGVLYNRLKQNMPLQVDPTVIYSLGKEYTGNISKKDIAVQSKFNTYVHRGLPPAPISAVSAESIRAAVNPAIHDLLYFVSMGNGKHFFSSTLEQHNQAVQKYQRSQVTTGNK